MLFSSKKLDVSLLSLEKAEYDNNPRRISNLAEEFGWISLGDHSQNPTLDSVERTSIASSLGADLFIPQHAQGLGKRISFGSMAGFAPSCQWEGSPLSDSPAAVMQTTTTSDTSYDVGYWVDTATGSSGSPVCHKMCLFSFVRGHG